MARKGREEPRIYTPPLRELTPDTTLGYDMREFAEQVLRIELLPWQRWWFVHAFEIEGDFGGEWRLRFRTILTLIGRQNGKTFLAKIVALYFVYVIEAALVIGTAQDLSKAEETWNEAMALAQEWPELAAEIEHIYKTNGKTRTEFTGGRQYLVKATTRKAGRGETADLVILDELREHTDWKAYSSVSKTTLTNDSAVVLCISNAGAADSVVLRWLRAKEHMRLGDPDGTAAATMEALGMPAMDDPELLDAMAIGLFEWSAEPGAEITDREGWAQANPSMGYTISERAIAASCASDPADEFKTECLCQWVTTLVKPPFPPGAWDAGRDELSAIAPDSPLWWGVDVSADRTRTSIAVCGLRADRDWHIEVAARGSGISWVADWFRERAAKAPMAVALQGRGAPASGLAEVLGAINGVTVAKCEGADVAAWTGRLYDGVAACDPETGSDARRVMHRTQPALDLAAQVAQTKALGDAAFAFDRNKSRGDISPLVACAMAHGLATAEQAPPKSAYEDEGHGLLFV